LSSRSLRGSKRVGTHVANRGPDCYDNVRMRVLLTRCVAVLGVLILGTVTALSLWPTSGRVSTDDRNGDGRPDVWLTYDRQGQIVEKAVDSNFDGRSDVREYYLGGQLVRRESDRNFDDRIDLVEDFDATTHQHTRLVADSDFDGTADLLVLFKDNRPVFSKRAPLRVRGRTAKAGLIPARRGDAPLAHFADPFAGDITLRSAPITSTTSDSVGTIVGVTVCPGPGDSRVRVVSAVDRLDRHPSVNLVIRVQSPRGPPLA
jgi:hypothetical protein